MFRRKRDFFPENLDLNCELGDTRSTCGICEFTAWKTLGFNQPEKEVDQQQRHGSSRWR